MEFFKAVVYKTGYTYQVDLPPELCKKFRQGSFVPVKGIINNEPYLSSLAPRKNHNFILFLNSNIRKRANISVGDTIEIGVEYDSDSREIDITEDVEIILKENGNTWQKFLSFTPSHRRELLLWVYDAKRPETRLKRIEKMIKHLSERKRN
jgi:hypothetical protein